MNSELDMRVSINYQLDRLMDKFHKNVTMLLDAEYDREVLFKAMVKINMCEEKKGINAFDLEGILPTIFLFQKKYRLAWLSFLCLHAKWDLFIRKEKKTSVLEFPTPLDLPYLADMCKMWEIYDSGAYVHYTGGIGKCRSFPDPAWLGALASPTSESTNESELENLMMNVKHGYVPSGDPEWGPDPSLFFNPAPEARYATCCYIPEFHLTPRGNDKTLFEYVLGLLANDRNLETWEWIFRMRHAISRRLWPQDDPEQPTLNQVAAIINCMEYWILGRLTGDPNQRRTLGWMSVYWLLESMVVSPVKHFLSWRFYYPFVKLCGLIAEFGLWGEEQAEFERQMKLFISLSGKRQAQRMLDDPTPAPSLADMGGLTGAEVVALFNKKIPSK